MSVNYKLGKKVRNVVLLNNDLEPVRITTSTLYSPFGVKMSKNDWSVHNEYYMSCLLNESKSENSESFKNTIANIDQEIEKQVKENYEIFNTKSKTMDGNFVYSPILRENGTYPKLMTIDFPRDKNGNFESILYDEQKNKMVLNESNIDTLLRKGRAFKAIIECVKVWYYNGKVGSKWRVVQLKFSEKNNKENSETDSEEQDPEQGGVFNSLMID